MPLALAPLRDGAATVKRAALRLAMRRRILNASRHLSGPARVTLGPDEVGCICLIRNAAYYLDVLLAHHRALGVAHFVFIDNGSQDGSLERLAREPDVSVVANALPVAHYECPMRAEIARHYLRGGWLLFIDSDELIDLPFDRNAQAGGGRQGVPLKLGDIASYCNRHGYDGIISHSIDLFSRAPLAQSGGWDYARSVADFDRYSLGAISDHPYHDPAIAFSWHLRLNRLSDPAIPFKFGGMRREVFGEDCALSKHSMLRNAGHIDLYCHPHCSNNLHCADFTLLLRHYKFAGRYLERERRQVEAGIWQHGEDRARLARIESDGFRFDVAQDHRFTGAGGLLAAGFLTASPAARALGEAGKTAG